MRLRDCNALLEKVKVIFFDFDGVFTDNSVYVSSDGTESVRCFRGDGIGLQKVKDMKLPCFIISTETNPVVAARARKLGVLCYQGVSDKVIIVKKLLSEYGLSRDDAIFVGNDVNDLAALQYVGLPILPADANPELLDNHGFIKCELNGGQGVVREICEAIYQSRCVTRGEV